MVLVSISIKAYKKTIHTLSILVHPFIPHISEEIWEFLGNEGLCSNAKWPESKIDLKRTKFNIAIQINGKTRTIIESDSNKNKEELIDIAINNDKINKHIINKKILKYIYVPEKILNIVLQNEVN